MDISIVLFIATHNCNSSCSIIFIYLLKLCFPSMLLK